MQIKIGFSASRSLHSCIIRWITRSPVSHVFFILEGLVETPLIAQADVNGVQIRTLRMFEKSSTVVRTVELPSTVFTGVVRAADWLGARYDFAGFLGRAVVLVGRRLKKKWKNPWNSTRALDCAEYVVRVLQLSGYPGADGLDPSGATPHDLFRFFPE